ncbi:putative toxin, partial [Streptomyces sp. NPDC057621]|uniref:putative toxin n=1 Tax=Streptomyces sp. NPDC057621 TaxID=3346186 RepID=UPI0036B12670
EEYTNLLLGQESFDPLGTDADTLEIDEIYGGYDRRMAHIAGEKVVREVEEINRETRQFSRGFAMLLGGLAVVGFAGGVVVELGLVGGSSVGSAGVVAESGVGAMAAGKAHEAAILQGLMGQQTMIASATGTAAYRFLDALPPGIGAIEVKWVSRLALTNQLKDFILFAQAQRLEFYLITRFDTVLSRPLRALIDSGVINWIPEL